MKEVTTILEFNSAISGIQPDGKFRDNDHDATVKPVRGLIMSQTDGITGMNIGRYGARVNHFAEIISADQVRTAFQTAIDAILETTDHTIFPLRGEKTPTVTLESTSAPKPSYRKTVAARFDTDIAAYTKDDKKWNEFTTRVGEALANINGARDYEIYLNEVHLTIDTRAVSVQAAQEHMDNVIQTLRREDVILPFAKDVRVKFRHFDVH